MDQFRKKPKPCFMVKYVSIIIFSLLFTLGAQAQHVVQGTVRDEQGAALRGASVSVRGTNLVTITDKDGHFSITVAGNESVLLFSHIGLQDQQVTVGASRSLSVVLKPRVSDLDEVVVIGYGTAKKSDLTGSVASIKGGDLEKFPAGNVTEMLRGQAAGIQVTQNNAAPGGSSDVYIRGKRSLSSSQSPLYIVDGMIVPNINDLNSSDIASIEVLKDASSQAIYGSRASNGVVLVTTIRGKSGKPTINFSAYTGTQKFTRNFDVYSPDEWILLRWWAKNNDGVGNIGTIDNINYETVLDDPIMLDAYQNKKFTNWEDLLLKNGLQYKEDVSLRGGSDKLKYAVGAGHFNQDGIVDKSGYQRGNFRANVDYSVYKWLDMGINFSYARAKTLSSDGRFYDVLTRPMLGQPYDDNGNLKREIDGAGNINPLWRSRERDEEQQNEFVNLSPYLLFKISKGLTFRFSANIRTNNRESGQYTTKLYPGSTGEGQIREFSRSSWLVNNTIHYQLPIKNDNHKLSITLIEESEQDLQKTTGMDFINSTTDLFKWNIAADAEVDNVVRAITRQRSTSFAGRLQYDLKNKYLLTASLRRDGVSVFGADHKWSNFPSIALAWKINEESFFQNQTWLDLLKARVSYGVVGNWGIPAYRTLGLANSYEYLLGDQLAVGYLPSGQLQNIDLQWEKTGSLNIGLDLSAFGSRLNSTIEYYNTNTSNLLIERTIPSNTGYGTMWDNLGKTKSWGWEGTINGKIIESRDFSWDLGFSISTQRNKILNIDGRTDDKGNPINDIPNNWFIGKPINVTYQYVPGGIWQEDQTSDPSQYLPGSSVPRPGDIKLADYNGDGQVTVDDRKVYELDPQWYGSINTSFSYKGIDLGLEFYTVQGVTKNNILLYNSDRGGSLNGKLNGVKVNYWTPENRSNEFPRPYYTAAAPNFAILGLQDASYFRLRTATIGYSLPKSLLPNLRMSKARVYATFTNLFTITDYKSYSPENPATEYPEPQTVVFGLNLSF
jgi:TonB-linked SusC/RagA family outer membrane protein